MWLGSPSLGLMVGFASGLLRFSARTGSYADVVMGRVTGDLSGQARPRGETCTSCAGHLSCPSSERARVKSREVGSRPAPPVERWRMPPAIRVLLRQVFDTAGREAVPRGWPQTGVLPSRRRDNGTSGGHPRRGHVIADRGVFATIEAPRVIPGRSAIPSSRGRQGFARARPSSRVRACGIPAELAPASGCCGRVRFLSPVRHDA